MGGKFSIYYYYAKYVAADPVWIDFVNSHSLEQTGIDIIKTFLSLPALQQVLVQLMTKTNYICIHQHTMDMTVVGIDLFVTVYIILSL